MTTTVICDHCGHPVPTGQPPTSLHNAMLALATAAKTLGYTVRSVDFVQANDEPETA